MQKFYLIQYGIAGNIQILEMTSRNERDASIEAEAHGGGLLADVEGLLKFKETIEETLLNEFWGTI